MEQVRRGFTNDQIKDIVQRQINKELKREHVQQMLRIKRRQFFKLLKITAIILKNFRFNNENRPLTTAGLGHSYSLTPGQRQSRTALKPSLQSIKSFSMRLICTITNGFIPPKKSHSFVIKGAQRKTIYPRIIPYSAVVSLHQRYFLPQGGLRDQ